MVLVGGTSLFRRGLHSFLDNDSFSVTGEFDTHGECIAAAETTSEPEIILYVTNGDEAALGDAVEALSGAYSESRVLVLAGRLSLDELGVSLRAGAAGYLLSTISKEALAHSLRLIQLGETVFPSDLANAWPARSMHRRPAASNEVLETLTPRENDILDCLTEGASNKVIARNLGITESTVKIHMKSLIRKIGVQNRTQAALWAIESGVGRPVMHDAA
jgi:two-component system nitrate/nitrite response regulator NarL